MAEPKRIYTSNFAKSMNHPQAVAITVRVPTFVKDMKHCDYLAPTWKMVDDYRSGRLSEEGYKAKYLELLRRKGLSPEDVLASLPDGAVLLCYEKSGQFCHRHLAAGWLSSLGEDRVSVEELP